MNIYNILIINKIAIGGGKSLDLHLAVSRISTALHRGIRLCVGLFVLMLAVSCSKSEPEAPVYEQMLTGEWDYNPGTSIHTALSYAFCSDHTFSYNNSKHQLASGEWQMPNDSIIILRKQTREGYEQSTLGVRFLSDQEMYITEGSTSMRFIKSAVNVSLGLKPWNDPEDITLGYDEGMTPTI